MPVYHRALAERLDRPHPVAVLNIGGVANVTFIDGIPDPYACDTGPGNALIDDFMRARKASRATRMAGGLRGLVDEAAVARVLKHSFFALTTTGVPAPMTGGVVAEPRSARRQAIRV